MDGRSLMYLVVPNINQPPSTDSRPVYTFVFTRCFGLREVEKKRKGMSDLEPVMSTRSRLVYLPLLRRFGTRTY